MPHDGFNLTVQFRSKTSISLCTSSYTLIGSIMRKESTSTFQTLLNLHF